MSRYFIFAIVSLSILLNAIGSTAISVAFPVITSSFDASLVLAGWVLSIYQIVATTAMVLAGKAGDIFGGKPAFLVSLSVFIIGSLLCAIAPNIQFLIVSRFIQAIGGGSFMPLAAKIVADEFPRARQTAIGLFSTIFPIGFIIGPNLGAWMVDSFGWRSIFWLNIPLGAIAFIASIFLLRSGKREKGHIDLAGASLFTGSLFAFIGAFSQMGNSTDKPSWVIPGLLFVVAVILIIAFIRHEGKNKNPIIDPQVLKERPFIAANIYNFIYGVCIFGTMSFVPLYTVCVYGMSILESGLILSARSVGMIVASPVTSIFLTRWGYRWPMLIGTAAIVLSLCLLGIESPGINILGFQLSSTTFLILIMLLAGIGMGVAAPAANNACIELMPDRVATIFGVRGMFRQSGGAISIAITSVLLHNITDMTHGFALVFFGLALVMTLISPSIFAMPKAP